MNLIKLICIFSLLFSSCVSQKLLSDELQTNKTSTVNNKAEINNIGIIVLFVKGEDKQISNILQDALSTKLKKFSWNVVDRTQLESEINKDYQAKQKISLKDSSVIVPLSYDEMTKLVNGSFYMTVDYSVGKKQYSNQIGTTGNSAIEKMVISSISFRIFKTGNRDPLAIGVLDFLTGQSPTYAASYVRNLIEEMKSGN